MLRLETGLGLRLRLFDFLLLVRLLWLSTLFGLMAFLDLGLFERAGLGDLGDLLERTGDLTARLALFFFLEERFTLSRV